MTSKPKAGDKSLFALSFKTIISGDSQSDPEQQEEHEHEEQQQEEHEQEQQEQRRSARHRLNPRAKELEALITARTTG